MPLPFAPEPEASLRLRYLRAVDEIINQDDVEAGRRPAPSSLHEHVFDFPTGLRLIVARERTPLGVGVHFSASFVADTDLARYLIGNPASLELAAEFCAYALDKWQTLARTDVAPALLGFSAGKAVPHWFLREDGPKPIK